MMKSYVALLDSIDNEFSQALAELKHDPIILRTD